MAVTNIDSQLTLYGEILMIYKSLIYKLKSLENEMTQIQL